MAPAETIFRLFTLSRVSLWRFSGEPKHLVLLWLGTAAIVEVVKAQDDYWYFDIGRPFAQLAGAILAAFLAAWMLRKGREAMRFAFAFLLIAAPCLLVQALYDRLEIYALVPAEWTQLALVGWAVAVTLRFMGGATGWATPADKGRAFVAVALVLTANFAWYDLQSLVMQYVAEPDEVARRPEIDAETVWTAQPALMAKALARLPETTSPASRTFIVSVAASGRQQIFGREANKVSAVLMQRFGAQGQAVTLSNASADLAAQPMANGSNLAETMAGIARHFDPERDVVMVYLTSHGNAEAELSTDLPEYTRLKPISAESLAKAFRDAGIARRIVVVSACHSGSWIKPLASPDTIVLTASAADRTSFGCDDQRDYTVFGETFIRTMSDKRASLQQAFESLKRDIDAGEASEGRRASLPQAFVGERMQAIWTARD